MTFIPIIFLALYILILALGAFIGYRRGVGKSAVRFAYLAVVGLLTFFIARLISRGLSLPLYGLALEQIPTDYLTLLQGTQNVELLLKNIIAATVNLCVFAVLFAVLQLLTLIRFGASAKKILSLFHAKKEASAHSKWGGALVGFASAVLTASFLLLPLYSVNYVIDTVPRESVECFIEAYDRNVVGAAEVTENPITPSIKITKLFPVSKLTADSVGRYKIPDTSLKDSVINFLPKLVELGSDTLYVHNETVYNEEISTVVINNSAATVTLHLENSPTVKYLAANAAATIGKILAEEGEFMGMELLGSDNLLVDSMIKVALKNVAKTDMDNVNKNMYMLFGTFDAELLPPHKRSDFETHFPHSGYNGKAHEGLLLIVLDFEYASASDLASNDELQTIIDKLADIIESDDSISDVGAEHADAHGLAIPQSVMDEILAHAGEELTRDELKVFITQMGYNLTDEEFNAVADVYLK